MANELGDYAELAKGVGNFGLGAWNSYKGAQQSRAQARELEAGLAEQRRLYGLGVDAARGYLSPLRNRGEDAWSQMQGMQFDKAPDVQQFEHDRQLEEFLDPFLQDQIRNSNRAIEGSQAGQGNLLSSKTMGLLQGNAQDRANRGWGDANQRMWQDKNFTYKTLMDQNNQQRQQWADNYGRMQDQYGRLATNYNLGNQATGQMGQYAMNEAQQMGNFAGQEAEIGAMRQNIPTGFQHFLNPTAVGGFGDAVGAGVDMVDQSNRNSPPPIQGMGMGNTQWNPSGAMAQPQYNVNMGQVGSPTYGMPRVQGMQGFLGATKV